MQININYALLRIYPIIGIFILVSACFYGRSSVCKPCISDRDCIAEQQICIKIPAASNGVCQDKAASYLCTPQECISGTTKECYDGLPQTLNRGVCKAGYRRCVNGVWESECRDQKLPQPETCNMQDDNCNGVVDEGICCVYTILDHRPHKQRDSTTQTPNLKQPRGLAISPSQSHLLIADPGQHIIWSLDLANRKLTTLVGNGSVGNLDAQGSKSSFNHPTGIVVTQNNIVYVSDTYNHRIRTFSLDDPLVMVSNYVGTGQRGFADDRGFPYMLCEPMGLALSRGIGINTNTLYIADHCNHLIRHVGTRGIINKYAGGDAGQQGYQDGLSARFNHPSALIFDALNNIYIADTDNHRIRRIDTSRRVSTISGDGQPGTRDGMYFEGNISNPQLNKPSDIAIDKYNQLFIVDTQNHRIRKINLQNNTTTTIAGSNRGFLDGSCNKALFSYPGGIAIDSEGHIYIGDTENQSIRIIVDKSN